MPDPLLYLKAAGTSVIVSALVVLAMLGVRRSATVLRLNVACSLGIGLGLALGCYVLSWRWVLPPANGLDRFLTIILPVILGIELLAVLQGVPLWITWSLRIGLAVAAPRILLHGSVYLLGLPHDWSAWQTGVALLVCSCLLVAVWSLLAWLSERSPGFSIFWALVLAIQCAGITVMMAGYIKGGTAGILLAAAITGATIGIGLATRSRSAPLIFSSCAIIGIGVVGLFGILFIGRFFGRLSTGSAVAMLLAPLLCWVTELPSLRQRKPSFVGPLRLVLVAIPLVVVLIVAKRNFDRDMAPLLKQEQASALRFDHEV